MKNLTKYSLVLLAGLSLTSCGDKDKGGDKDKTEESGSSKPKVDTKESIINEVLDMMDKAANDLAGGNEKAIEELEPEMEKLMERAKKVGLNGEADFETNASEAQLKRHKEIQKKMMETMMSKAKESMSEGQ